MPLNFSINFVFLQRLRTAQFLCEDYILCVLVRDEKWEFLPSLICDVRKLFLQNSYLLLLELFQQDQGIFTGFGTDML